MGHRKGARPGAARSFATSFTRGKTKRLSHQKKMFLAVEKLINQEAADD